MSKGAKGTLVIIGGAERKDDVRLHVLGVGDCFDLSTRRPIVPKEEPEKELEKAPAAADEE